MAVTPVSTPSYVTSSTTNQPESTSYRSRTETYASSEPQGGAPPNDFGPNTTQVKMTAEGNRHDEAVTHEADAQKNAADKNTLDTKKEDDRFELEKEKVDNKAKLDEEKMQLENKKEDNRHTEAVTSEGDKARHDRAGKLGNKMGY